MNNSEIRRFYTSSGSFPLQDRNGRILGEISYMENTSNRRRLYRICDFTRALHLNSRFSQNVKHHHRFPASGFAWGDWPAIRGALRRLRRAGDDILEIGKRKSPEEPLHVHAVTVSEKRTNPLIRLLQSLPKDNLPQALLTFQRCQEDFAGWLTSIGGDPENYHLKDLQEFTALDYLRLLRDCGVILRRGKTEPAPESRASGAAAPDVSGYPCVELQTPDGRNLQITVNVNLRSPVSES